MITKIEQYSIEKRIQALLSALKNEDIAKFKFLCEFEQLLKEQEKTLGTMEVKHFINTTIDEEGHTALHLAAQQGNFLCLLYLLNLGADSNTLDVYKNSAIIYSFSALLFEHSYDSSYTPSLQELYLQCFDQLILIGCDLNIYTNGTSMLFIALQQSLMGNPIGDLLFRRLLNHGANPNFGCLDTPLHIAIQREAIEMVELLLEHGADPNYSNFPGYSTPLEVAYAYEKAYPSEVSRKIRELIVSYVPKISINTLIDQSMRTNIEFILTRFEKFKMEAPDPRLDQYIPRPDNGTYNFTRTEYCKNIYLETKKFFDEHQDSLSPKDKLVVLKEYIRLWNNIGGVLDIQDTEFAEKYKNTMFGKYYESYNKEVPMLYSATYERESTYHCFEDNLLTASRDGKLTEVRELVEMFPDLLDTPNSHCNTPLHMAVISGQVEVIKYLLKKSAKINAINKSGNTPFREALYLGSAYSDQDSLETFKKIVKLFVDAGLDLNGTAHISNSYLGELAQIGSLEACKILYSHGADINIQDVSGNTPLHLLARNCFERQEEIATWFMKSGADKDLKNGLGQTPLDLAKKNELHDVVYVLNNEVRDTTVSDSGFGFWIENQSNEYAAQQIKYGQNFIQ